MKRFSILAAIIFTAILTAFNTGTSRNNALQDVFIFCPDELDPGAKASFRVVVMEALGISESRPVDGARVEIWLEGAGGPYQIMKSRTNSRGTLEGSARVPDIEEGKDYELVIKVSSDLGKQEKRHKVKITPRFRVLLSSDKPLYQPGQVIHLRAVALKVSNLKPVSSGKVTLEVEDPQGNKVFKRAGSTDRFGIYSADFTLADEIRLGDYVIRAVVGGREAQKTVTVKRYVLPKFKVTLDTKKSYYRPGETVRGTISASYFFGKAVDGGEVKVIARTFDVEFHKVAEVTGRTDKDGNFEFELELPDYFAGQPLEKGDAFVMLDASVTDLAKHTEKATIQRKVAKADLRLELVPEAGRIVPGVENNIYAIVATPDDNPVQANITVNVGGKTLHAESDDTGIAVFAFTPKPEDFKQSGGNYVLAITGEARDRQGRKVEVVRELSADNLRDSVLLRVDRAIYTAGDDMKVQVLSTFKRGTVYLDLIRNRRTVQTRALDIKNGRAGQRISLGPDLFGTLELHAYVILPSGEIMRDTRVVYVEPADDLEISVSLDKDTYRPGESARLIFKVKDKKGRGHQGALGISIVDESVFAIQEMQPGLLKVYFTLEKELAKPRYEIHFSPGGRTVQSLIQDKTEARAKKDKVMKVLLAGVKNPTSQGWQDNPAKERMAKEKSNLQTFTYSFLEYAKTHKFIERKRGEWRYVPGIAEQMVEDKVLDKDYAYDSFGRPYDPSLLTVVDPALDLRTVSDSAASNRLLLVYQALDRFTREEQSWLEKLFDNAPASSLPDDILDALVEKKFLDKSAVTDPWGRRFVITKKGEDFSNPYYGNTLKHFDVRSRGADGKIGTDDDITDPWLCQKIPFMQACGFGWREESMDGDMMMFEGAGGRVRALAAMPAAMPKKAMARGGGEMLGFKDEARSDSKRNGGNKPIRIREYFPETLLWEPALITDRWGNAELTVPLADSITTWRLTALGHSGKGLLGSGASGIRVFQDFFVDIDFPVQLTQGDEVEVPVAVYNYLPGSQTITLEVREHDGFELLSDSVQKLKLSAGQVDVRYFRVKAQRVGKKTLTIFALGDKMSDAVKRSVDIIPDGKRYEVVRNGRLTGPLTEEIAIPRPAISEASRVMVKIYPGVFAQVLEGMDSIFRMPHGCFEQTTSTTYPNVMALAYMKKTDTVSPEIRLKAEGFINLGYQRLLSFEVPGGGFEWFGRAPAHKVLTAYGLMEFYDMSKVYPIDENVIKRTQKWLADQQERDGSWKPVEHWIETLSGDDFSRSVELNTAYISWALAESEYQGDATDKGIGYLKDHLKQIKDAYTLALAVNAMIAADPDDKDARDLLRRLDSIKIEDKKTGTVHWTPKGETAVHGSGKSGMVETTSLILYAMTKAGMYPATTNKGLAWISQQKDAFGTFQSTQATILAFKALLAAEEGAAPDVRGEIMVSLGGRREKITITPEDSEVLRLIDFKDQTTTGVNQVKIEAPEDMGLMYQVVGIYYLPWDQVKEREGRPLLSLDVKYDRTQLKEDDILTSTVTASYHGDKATDMVILDLGIPPGFKLIPDALEELKQKNLIEKYSATGRQITVYVRRIETNKPLSFSYQLKAKFPVKAQTPKSTAYEYYNPDRKVEARPVQIRVTR